MVQTEAVGHEGSGSIPLDWLSWSDVSVAFQAQLWIRLMEPQMDPFFKITSEGATSQLLQLHVGALLPSPQTQTQVASILTTLGACRMAR